MLQLIYLIFTNKENNNLVTAADKTDVDVSKSINH